MKKRTSDIKLNQNSFNSGGVKEFEELFLKIYLKKFSDLRKRRFVCFVLLGLIYFLLGLLCLLLINSDTINTKLIGYVLMIMGIGIMAFILPYYIHHNNNPSDNDIQTIILLKRWSKIISLCKIKSEHSTDSMSEEGDLIDSMSSKLSDNCFYELKKLQSFINIILTTNNIRISSLKRYNNLATKLISSLSSLS